MLLLLQLKDAVVDAAFDDVVVVGVFVVVDVIVVLVFVFIIVVVVIVVDNGHYFY